MATRDAHHSAMLSFKSESMGSSSKFAEPVAHERRIIATKANGLFAPCNEEGHPAGIHRCGYPLLFETNQDDDYELKYTDFYDDEDTADDLCWTDIWNWVDSLPDWPHTAKGVPVYGGPVAAGSKRKADEEFTPLDSKRPRIIIHTKRTTPTPAQKFVQQFPTPPESTRKRRVILHPSKRIIPPMELSTEAKPITKTIPHIVHRSCSQVSITKPTSLIQPIDPNMNSRNILHSSSSDSDSRYASVPDISSQTHITICPTRGKTSSGREVIKMVERIMEKQEAKDEIASVSLEGGHRLYCKKMDGDFKRWFVNDFLKDYLERTEILRWFLNDLTQSDKEVLHHHTCPWA